MAGAGVIAPVWQRFLSTYPEVHLELQLGEAPVDIVAKGFDAGVGTQDRADADMIAVRVTGPLKVAVVGAPSYFARRPRPRVPDDLARHSCVQYRRGADGVVFEWPFERNGKSQKTSVDGRVMVNNPDLALRAAVDGLGIAYTIEAYAEPFLRSGQLVRVSRTGRQRSRDCSSIIPGAAGSRRSARAHRHDPHLKLEARQEFAPEPVRGALGLILPAP